MVLPTSSAQAGLKGYEDSLHMLDAYRHLAKSLPEHFQETEKAEQLKALYNERILRALAQSKGAH
ncbi:hypothetical protein D3C81_2286870 [compost metagenome]